MGLGFLFYRPVVNRVEFFVDGFNLYHALIDNHYNRYKWLDLLKLAKCFIKPQDQVIGINYFTSYVVWDPQKVSRHQVYTSALQSVGVKIVFGSFKAKDRKCRNCNAVYKTFEEKQTDVNIAIKLFQSAINNVFDTAIIVSGDSDLVPAIEAVKTTFPAKSVGVVIPIGRRAESLKNATDFHMKMKEKHLSTCQFPDAITLPGGRQLCRPV